MRLGFDFDNTVIRYDEVFHALAAQKGWIPARLPKTKDAVKAHLLKADGNDLRWQSLQARAYGPEIMKAAFFPGCLDVLKWAKAQGHEVFIVSHKTERSHFDRNVRLRDWARRWLSRHGGGMIPKERVFFASTRDEKVAKVRKLGLDLFVDDMQDVLEHSSFPSRTFPLHFGPQVANWSDVAQVAAVAAEIGAPALRAARDAFGVLPVKAERAGGGNNRLIKLTFSDGRVAALKRYLVDPRDKRNRGRVEFEALELLWSHGIRNIPKPIYLSPDAGFALLSWISGRRLKPAEIGRKQTLAAATFLKRVAALRPKRLQEAADSRRRLKDYPDVIEARLSRILAGVAELRHPEAKKFVDKELLPAKEILVARFRADAAGRNMNAPFPARERIPSPSDFGFHNVLADAQGRLFFLDFEYFGMDDAAKLACDFCHHAGHDVSPENKRMLVEALASVMPDRDVFLERVDLVYDLIGLAWILIVLNVLAPEVRARRRFADSNVSERALIDARLREARRRLKRLMSGRRDVDFPQRLLLRTS